jgi:hypothetical protein
VVLDTFDSGPLASPTEWLLVSDLRQIPAETRWIRVRLFNIEPGDAYFDDLSLRSLRAATVILADTEVYEGDDGFIEAPFNIQMACPFHQTVEADFVTTDFDAVAGEDYLASSQIVTIDVGDTEATVPVQIIGDTVDEPHESFLADLTLAEPTDAVLLDGEGLGIIFNDDFCPQGADFWFHSPDAETWPVAWLEIGGTSYGAVELLRLLGYTGRNDESHNLARELIATKFNLAKGSKPGTIQSTVDEADLFLVAWPPGSKPNGPAAKEARGLAVRLEEYNTPACP